MSILDVVRDLFSGIDRMSQEDADLWWEARTLKDLGERVALWLEFAIDSQPGYASNCHPDEETWDLVPVLAAANRAGFVTHGSQPGTRPEIGYDGAVWEQRAAVDGFANAVLAQRIHDVCASAGLIVHMYPSAGRRGEKAVPVTIRNGCRYTGFGHRLPRRLIRFLYRANCNDDAVDALLNAHQVTVIDPEWGRDDYLWVHLAEAITWKDDHHDPH
jgi:hypothetical protein